ncbi:MAG: 3-phosphoshikimate 1-carboxyvinyltransferase, partial [Lachnospiraceae bacterium]|nr:3-phosphoshikimate 1-carboxyvinyltransferase [Lachnospiraceae bacterium]
MNILFEPSRAEGKIPAPPSKSLSHRAVLSALLSHGVSRIENAFFSEDIRTMADAAEVLGAGTIYEGRTLTVKGNRGQLPKGDLTLDARESGSVMRFLIPLMWLREGRTEILGTQRLLKRPLTVYEDIAKEQGLLFEIKEDRVITEGGLKPGLFHVRGDISSQFITGLLFALPLLQEDSTIRFTTRVESFPYMELTRWFLKDFGIVS